MAAAKRSPVRGYNHNIRHRGLVFHIQTEDSGVDNPHVFTHVFYGGIILSTRKLTYDCESAEEVVKSLMQAQHKATLKDLKHGKLREKIDAYLGDNPELEPATPQPGTLSPETPRVEPFAPPTDVNKSISAAFDAIRDDANVPSPVEVATTDVYVKPGHDSISVTAPTLPAASRREAAPPGPPSGLPSTPPLGPPPQARATRASARTATPRSAPAKARARSGTPRASGVVVSRPAVIVSAPPKVVGRQSSRPPRARKAREDKTTEGLFGQGLISEKSLDEVILAYLSDDAGEE